MTQSQGTPKPIARLPQIRLQGKWYTLAQAGALAVKEQDRGNEQFAVEIYDLILAKDPDYVVAHFNRGMLMPRMGRFDEALASYGKVIELNPNNAEAYNNMGRIWVSKGNMIEAEKMFLKSIALNPDCATPLLNLTGIRRYQDVNHADIKSIQTMLGRPTTSARDREHLHYALGKIYDDCGHYDEAFQCYQKANEISNSRVSYHSDGETEMTNRIMDVFNQEFFARTFAFASDDPSPLFIVGMPRSGTSLLAQILSNHPSIANAGELTTMIGFTANLPRLTGNSVPYPEAVRHLTPTIAARLIRDYQERLKRDAEAGVSYIVDKMPLNFRQLGFIAMLFPKARILHCTRNPLDTALSNYFQPLGPDYDYSFDLRNIAHFYGEYTRLMEHWRTVLPLKMIEINYEDTINNTEKIARKALDFLGLEWNERCLAPHTNPGVVFTLSHWQVRQPIYTQSVERWRYYEKHLGPLKDLLPLP
jgi:tetratricopeptide (TPR) repeat protein